MQQRKALNAKHGIKDEYKEGDGDGDGEREGETVREGGEERERGGRRWKGWTERVRGRKKGGKDG